MILQVEVALNGHDETSLSNLTINDAGEGVQKLTAWKPVSEYWHTQPSDSILSVFVKPPATGELSSSPVNMNIADVMVSPAPIFPFLPFVPRLALLASNPDIIGSPATPFPRPPRLSPSATRRFSLLLHLASDDSYSTTRS
jgi:hypothetical protein